MSRKMRWGIGIVVIAVLVLGVGGYLGAGYAIYLQLSPARANCTGPFIDPNVVNNTPDNFLGQYGIRYEVDVEDLQMSSTYEEVEFLARGDEVTIRAWYVPSETESEDVVIVVHGVHSCRKYATALMSGGMLHHADYNVLLIDLRNHGDSEVTDGRATAGNLEHLDILGAYDWLIERGFASEDIGLIGFSMGGASSINAFGEEQGIAALWADSSFADMREVLESEMERNNYPAFFTQAGLFVTDLMGIDLLEFSPLESIAKNNNRPIFITHGTADARLSIDYAPELYEQAGENAEIWIVEGTDHLEAMFVYTDEYEERLVNFFDAALKDDE